MIRLPMKMRVLDTPRRGVVLPLAAALMVVLIGMLAFSVDLGYISLVRGQMQSAADSAALAGASQLFQTPQLAGSTYQDTTLIYNTAQKFATANKGGGVNLTLGSSDVEYGYIETPEDPSSPFQTNVTPYNSVRVTVRRTTNQNGEVGLFFAKIFNRNALPLTATATATMEGEIGGFEWNDNYSHVNSLLLPFTIKRTTWLEALDNDGIEDGTDNWRHDAVAKTVLPGADSNKEVKLFPTRTTSGNFGTLDLGGADNSSDDIERQIYYGPNKQDFSELPGGKLELNDQGYVLLNGDTGISAGFKDGLKNIQGQPRIIPLYEEVTSNGNNSTYKIVEFVGCVICDVKLTGEFKYIIVQPAKAVDVHAKGGGPTSSTSFAFQPLRLTR